MFGCAQKQGKDDSRMATPLAVCEVLTVSKRLVVLGLLSLDDTSFGGVEIAGEGSSGAGGCWCQRRQGGFY